jgi:hypothetical protein
MTEDYGVCLRCGVPVKIDHGLCPHCARPVKAVIQYDPAEDADSELVSGYVDPEDARITVSPTHGVGKAGNA